MSKKAEEQLECFFAEILYVYRDCSVTKVHCHDTVLSLMAGLI